jgi:hypothetical protein
MVVDASVVYYYKDFYFLRYFFVQPALDFRVQGQKEKYVS